MASNRPFIQLYQYERERIRRFFAKHGKEGFLKPGVCWPNKQELQFNKEFEQHFYPSLNKLMEDMVLKRKEKENEFLAKEREYLKNAAKRQSLIAKFREKQRVLVEEEETERKKQEKIVAEVREYLGFNIEKTDPRFQEALAKKEEEARAAAKKAVKRDKKTKVAMMLQQLLGVSQEEVLDRNKKPEEKSSES